MLYSKVSKHILENPLFKSWFNLWHFEIYTLFQQLEFALARTESWGIITHIPRTTGIRAQSALYFKVTTNMSQSAQTSPHCQVAFFFHLYTHIAFFLIVVTHILLPRVISIKFLIKMYAMGYNIVWSLITVGYFVIIIFANITMLNVIMVLPKRWFIKCITYLIRMLSFKA